MSAWGASHAGTPFEDVAYLRLEYGAIGATANIHVSWLDPSKVRRVTVVGSQRMAVYDDMLDEGRLRIYDKGVQGAPLDGTVPMSYRYGGITAPHIQMTEPLGEVDRDFVQSALDGRTPQVDGRRGLAVVEVSRPPPSRWPPARTVEHLPARQRLTAVSLNPRKDPTSVRIPFNDLATPHASIVEDVVAEVRALAGNSRFIGGPAVEAFEQDFAAYCRTTHAVGVANGTDAIELTLRALGIGGGDEVLVPANTFIATASGVAATGATPVFVDVDPVSLLVTPASLEAADGPDRRGDPGAPLRAHGAAGRSCCRSRPGTGSP